MIGIPQLDRLSIEDKCKIIEGKMKIKVRDPRKIQVVISDIIEPFNSNDLMLDDYTVLTLLKMELESILSWEDLRKKIMENNK